MSAPVAVQALVSGLAAGAVYALLGVAFTLVYRLAGVLNFAAGDIATLSIFAFLAGLGAGQVPAGIAALLAGAAAGFAVNLLAVEPWRGRGGALGWVAGTAAAGALMRGAVRSWYPAESYSAPDLLPGAGRVVRAGSVTVDVHSVLMLVAAAALALILERWLSRSRTGLAMQAASQDEEGARLAGISPRRLRRIAWLLAGATAAVAGLLLAPVRPVTADLGAILGLKGAAAAVLGGLGGPRGAIAGGVVLGLVDSVAALGPPPVARAHDVIAVALLVLALAFFPGRLGASEAPPP